MQKPVMVIPNFDLVFKEISLPKWVAATRRRSPSSLKKKKKKFLAGPVGSIMVKPNRLQKQNEVQPWVARLWYVHTK